MINGREVALDILIEVLEKQAFSHIVIRQALEKYGYLTKQERAFISRLAQGLISLCFGILRRLKRRDRIVLR